jgi:hypothetical protein
MLLLLAGKSMDVLDRFLLRNAVTAVTAAAPMVLTVSVKRIV